AAMARPRTMAASTSASSPPSEKLSGVTFSTPITTVSEPRSSLRLPGKGTGYERLGDCTVEDWRNGGAKEWRNRTGGTEERRNGGLRKGRMGGLRREDLRNGGRRRRGATEDFL